MKKLILLLSLAHLTVFGQQIFIKHTAYEIHFDTVIHEPIYTHYILTKEMLNGNFDRSSFKPDLLLKKELQGSSKDYLNSAYDKGHLAPNYDFREFDNTQKESMVYTNCAPQNPYFNRGIWKSLENHVRDIAKNNDVEIWTGCVYKGSKEHLGKLLVPTYYWKMIKCNGLFYAWKIPNIKPKSNDTFDNYKTDYKQFIK